jgi:hypothetical protein
MFMSAELVTYQKIQEGFATFKKERDPHGLPENENMSELP